MPLTARLREEAGERYAAIMTDEEDLGLEHRISMMSATAGVMQALFERSGENRLPKDGQAPASHGDGTEVSTCEWRRLITRRGVVAMESDESSVAARRVCAVDDRTLDQHQCRDRARTIQMDRCQHLLVLHPGVLVQALIVTKAVVVVLAQRR